MNIQRFAANLEEARRNALIVVEAKNNISVENASNLLEKIIENMAEELNTLIQQRTCGRIDKDALLKSLLEDAELQRQYWNS
jgi:hypothetical protein